MKIIALRHVIQRDLKQWVDIYTRICKVDPILIDRIGKLNQEAVTVPEIEQIIGNGSGYFKIECSECDQEVPEAVQLDLEEEESLICRKCLQNALGLTKPA